MQTVDWLVAAVYAALVVVLGTMLGRKQQGASDYFLGRHSLPWPAILVSVVATETSALTVISVPGIGFAGQVSFVQLALGYLIGRIAVAWLLLPGYFTGEMKTAYEVLGIRWGDPARRTASAIFMLTRALATAVRLFAGAIPLAVITGWSYPASIVAVGAATVIYTYVGGIRSVVWVDVVQWTVYIIAGIATLIAALHLQPGALGAAAAAGRLHFFDWSISLTNPYAFGTALIGGAFLSAASHGTDHLIVQRLLATRALKDARAALIGSGIVVIAEFTLFLLVGAALWSAFPEGRAMAGDAIFPAFVVAHLGGGLAGIVLAGILAAAMGSTASALNSLASATTHDYYAALHPEADDARLLKVGRAATIAWAALLIGGALLFRGRNTPVVVVALSIASLTYGALLGAFILARFSRVNQRDAIAALVLGSLIMAIVVFAGPIGITSLSKLAWPWYVPLGVLVTVSIGLVSSFAHADRR
ncbi:MAG TPA: sodium:solute symporter [Gemmatimonadales bacterium]|jgi:SSS family transporter